MLVTTDKKQVVILHGAGYVGGELLRLLLGHPEVAVAAVTSRSHAGQPVWQAHPALRGQTELRFSDQAEVDFSTAAAVMSAAEHGRGAATAAAVLDAGFDGVFVDLSADFRFADADHYEKWFGFAHPAPALLPSFAYGLVEACTPYPTGTRYVANPGCFASAIALGLWPLAQHIDGLRAAVTALTGASGSGARPKEATHYPTRDGNVKAYKVLAHQHLPEVQQVLGPAAHVAFTPASGPWTRGIWGTAHVTLPGSVGAGDVADWYEAAYGHRPLIRLWPGALPELRYAAGTPFCDIGWISQGSDLVVGFAIDNLLKGAASQAIQNMNLLLGLPETTGLLPEAAALSVMRDT